MTLAHIACCDKDQSDPNQGKFPHPCGCPVITLEQIGLGYDITMIGWREGQDPDQGIMRTLPWRTFRNFSAAPASGYSSYSSPVNDCYGTPYRNTECQISGSYSKYVEADGTFTEYGSLDFPVSCTQSQCNGGFADPPFSVSSTVNNYDAFVNQATYPNGFRPNDIFHWDNSLQYWEDWNFGVRIEHKLSVEDTEIDAEKRAFFQDPDSVSDDPNSSTWGDPESPAWNPPNTQGSVVSIWEVRSATAEFTNWTRNFVFYKLDCTNLAGGFTYKVTVNKKKHPAVKEGSGGYSDPSEWVDATTDTYQFTATSDSEVIGGSDYQGIYLKLENIRGWQYYIFSVAIEVV